MINHKLIDNISAFLKSNKLDGWLMCGFGNRNPLITKLIGIDNSTRRFFLFFKVGSKPILLFSNVEFNLFDHIRNVNKNVFLNQSQLITNLGCMFNNFHSIAIDSNPNLPSVSFVDNGIIELIKSSVPHINLFSSADLIQNLFATWNSNQLKSHIKSAKLLDQIIKLSFEQISSSLDKSKPITQRGLQSFIIEQFDQNNLVSDHLPMVAFGRNTANPHFITENSPDMKIQKNMLVMIDIWAKLSGNDSIFADITWIGFTGKHLPQNAEIAWKAVANARDNSIGFIQKSWKHRKSVKGFEVDDIARKTLDQLGLGKFFIHRTGHSIGMESHDCGVNLDNFESHDDRTLIPRVGFSIEPGIYLNDFGIRSEINMFIDPKKGPTVTTPMQKGVILL